MALNKAGSDQILRVTDLCKRYGKTEVLSQLALSVNKAAIHGLVGLNGSGKTTTLECLLGLQSFDSGTIELLNLAPHELYKAQGRIVGIFDSPSLNPSLTVRQTLVHATLLCTRPVRSPAELEDLLGISRYRNYRINQLSLGNRRRASIAQALVGRPELVILDEPFNGLDAGGVEDVLALISRLNQEEGTTFLLSSHQLPYLEHICSHLAILHQGRIVLNKAVTDLFAANQLVLCIRCTETDRAMRLLQSATGVDQLTLLADGQLRMQLTDTRPEKLNALLVQAGIAVSELRPEQASLTSLFHELTGTATAPEHQRDDREAAA
ncbi:MAG: ABC transporter ATP-binding protein [Pseudomonadales bacterium]|nr:ABC transporter ATP-binding protein [Pseudomonadales bacterium]